MVIVKGSCQFAYSTKLDPDELAWPWHIISWRGEGKSGTLVGNCQAHDGAKREGEHRPD